MKRKRISREVVIQIIFQLETQNAILKNQINTELPKKIDNLSSFISTFINNFYLKDKSNIDVLFVEELLKGVLNSLAVIDANIQSKSDKWRIERMDAIDRSILRLATFELCITKKISLAIVIDEALEIAKKYGSEHSSAFINGILDSLAKK